MADISRYRRPLVQFFRSPDKEGLYANVIISGPEGGRKVMVTAIAGLYANYDLVSLPMAPGGQAPSKSTLKKAIGNYRFNPGSNIEAEVLVPGDDPAKLDEFLWDLAASGVGPSLPIAFLSFLTVLDSGEEQVAFWYTPLVPGEWLFRIFKTILGLR
jgi:hypothetical protein